MEKRQLNTGDRITTASLREEDAVSESINSLFKRLASIFPIVVLPDEGIPTKTIFSFSLIKL